MATFKESYNARIKKNGTTIAGIKSGSFNTGKGIIDITYLGSLAKENLMGLMDSSLDLTIMLDTSSTEQEALWDAYLADTKLTDITIYYDSTAYIECDTGNDANAGVYVTNYPISNLSPDDSVVETSITLKFSGLIKRNTD